MKICGCDDNVPYREPLDRFKQVITCHKCEKSHNLLFGAGREIWNSLQSGKYKIISPTIKDNKVCFIWNDLSNVKISLEAM